MSALFKKRSRYSTTMVIALMLVTLSFREGIAQQPNPNAKIKPQQLKSVIVTAYPTRFVPSSADVSNRKFMLIVRKKDGPKSLDLSFERLGPNDQPIGQLKHGQASAVTNWITVLTLQPGRYRLTESGPAPRAFVLTVH